MKDKQKKIIKLSKNDLLEMAMTYDADEPNRPHSSIERALANKETSLSNINFPDTGDENQNFQEHMASIRFKELVNRLKTITGLRNLNITDNGGVINFQKMISLFMSVDSELRNIERSHKTELENLAIRLIVKEHDINTTKIRIKAKLMPPSEILKVANPDETEEVDIDYNDEAPDLENEMDTSEWDEETRNMIEYELNFTLEKSKRRFINALTQGMAKKSHFKILYLEEIERELIRITGNQNIVGLYGTIMSINDYLYWSLPNSAFIDNMKQSFGGLVNVKDNDSLNEQNNEHKYTIEAYGANFAILYHELSKGVMEILSRQGLKYGDDETRQEILSSVIESEDNFYKEIWDIRLGPVMWQFFTEQLPEEVTNEESQPILKNLILTDIFSLPAKEFLVLMVEILGKTQKGKDYLQDLTDAIKRELYEDEYENNNDYEDDGEDDGKGLSYDDLMNNFHSDLKEYSDGIDYNQLRKQLRELGIDMPDDDKFTGFSNN